MALKGTKALLVWAQRSTEGYKDVKVENMTKSWRDGMAFCAIIHHFRPDLIDYNSLSKENVHENCSLAFDVAERELGIPSLLDPEDMAAMLVPDKLSIMTYVSQYYNFFKDKKPANKDQSELKPKGKLASLRRSYRKSKDKDKDSKDGAPPSKKATISDKCKMCGKHVYMIERQVVDGRLYHRACFKCSKCSTTLRPGSYKNTKDPKKFECLHHSQSNDMMKLRSKMANRAGSRLAKADNYEDMAIWQMQRSKSMGSGKKFEKHEAPVSHPGKTSPGPTRPVSKPPPVPASSGAVGLHPHLLAAASARTQFGATKDTEQTKSRPSSKETDIEDVAKGAEIPPSKLDEEPVRKTSTEVPPVRKMSADAQPVQKTSADAVPVRKISADTEPVRKISSEKQPVRKISGETESVRKSSTEAQLVRKIIAAAPPVRKTSAEEQPVKKTSIDASVSKDSGISSVETKIDTPASKETDIDPPTPKETALNDPASKETCIDEVTTDLNKTQDTTGDSMSLKSSTTSDSASMTSREGLTTSQDSLLKNGDSNKKDDILIKTDGNNDDNMNAAEKSDEEKEFISSVKKYETSVDIKVGSCVKQQENKVLEEVEKRKDEDKLNPFGDGYKNPFGNDEDDEQSVEEKKDEKWESENVKEKDVLKGESSKLNNDVKQAEPKAAKKSAVSLNPFADDLDEEEENKTEMDDNILNEKTQSQEDLLMKKGAGNAEVARLAVQANDLGDASKSASSIEDMYDKDLNPFADDGDDEMPVEQKAPKEYNPFDTDSDDQDEYDRNLNPFGDDDDEMGDTSGALNPFISTKPSRPPPPRATQDQSSSFQVKTRQQILQEMHVNRDTIKMKKKRPAPRRPPPPNAAGGTPSPVQAPPRRKTKNRKAPPPPPGGSTPKTTPDTPPPITISPSPQQNGSSKPVPSPRLSLLAENPDNNNSPAPTKSRLIIVTPDDQGTSDGEDRNSPRSRRATTCGVNYQKKKGRIGSHSPSRGTSSSSKRKAPLPPAIKRDVTKDHEDPMQIQNQLAENEKSQRELEQTGIELENKLRATMEAPEGDQESEDVLIEWFKLVNDRNKLIRKEGEFIAQLQMQELEVQHADIEYELRCLMNKQEHERTDADQEKEEKLLEMLVEVVTRRSSVVERLEADRIKEKEEDENIRQMMAESGLTKESKEKEGKKKKDKKKKKDHKATWHVR